MKTPKFGKRLLIAVLVVLSITLLLGSNASGKSAETGAVCPHSNVKWETDGGYEYTDGSATVSGNSDTITVTAISGYEVTGVCIKIGGPGGGSLIYMEGPGTYGPFDYGISHVVVTTTEETVEPSYKLSVGSCLAQETNQFQLNAYNKSNVAAHWRLKGTNGVIIDLGTMAINGHVQVTTMVETTWVKQVEIDGQWVNKGGTHVTSVAGHTENGFFCETPEKNWELGIRISDAFCREEKPYMSLEFTNLGDEATFKVVHSSGEVVFNQNLGVGQSSGVTIDLFGSFNIFVWDANEFLKLGTVSLNPDLECKEGDDEEGFTKIVRTVIDCPVCEGSGALEVLDIGDKPVAWDYRAEDCYLITTTRGIGTSNVSTTTKTACQSKGSIVVVAPANMTIFGDIEGYSTSQVLEADHLIVINGKDYKVYFTNYNAYADVNEDGKANWHEKLKHNWWRGIWQYETFCCAGFPLVDTDEGLAIIKLPRICFNGVQLAIQEAGIMLTGEQMEQVGIDYVSADYGEIIPIP